MRLFPLICTPDKVAQAAAQAVQTTAMQSVHFNHKPPPPLPPGALTQRQAVALLTKFSAQGDFNGGSANAAPATCEIENLFLGTSYGGPFVGSDQKNPEAGPSNLNTSVPPPEIHRAHPNFSPDPNIFYMSSESARHDSTHSFLETLPHPSKVYPPGFFPSQDLKVGAAISGSGLPSSTRPSTRSGHRFELAENSDPPALLNGAPGRVETPVSCPPSGQIAPSPDEGHITDVNDATK